MGPQEAIPLRSWRMGVGGGMGGPRRQEGLWSLVVTGRWQAEDTRARGPMGEAS